MSFNEYTFSLTPYSLDSQKGTVFKKRLESAKNMDGFISPNGDFYAVCERGSIEAVHDDFADVYVYNKENCDIREYYKEYQRFHPNLRGINLGPKDILIHLFGFICYEDVSIWHRGEEKQKIEVTIPSPKFGNRMTNSQFATLQALIKINKDPANTISEVNKPKFTMDRSGYHA